MTILLDLLYGLVVCLGWPFLLYRRLKRGPGSLNLRERLGDVPSRAVSSHCVWIHGVSLGEINATRTLVAQLREETPDWTVVISSTTQTGLQRARSLYPKLLVFRFPLDFSFCIRRVLRRVRPSIIVLMELEAWPNLIEVARAWNVPVVIANGRVTEEKSMRRFGKPVIRNLARRMFSQIRWVGAQDEAQAGRFVRLGVPEQRIELTGSVKYDAADVADHIDGQEELADAMTLDVGRPLWVCGSTGPGEEALILDAYVRLRNRFTNLQLAIVPRKPERFDEVAELIAARGFACLRRSGKPPVVPRDAGEPIAVFLGDTLGELRKFYALADVAFVGRTLMPMGGSDVMEVAALAKPVIVGPHTENFAEAVQKLRAADGLTQLAGADELDACIASLLENGERRRQMGSAARETILASRGATQRTVGRLREIVESV